MRVIALDAFLSSVNEELILPGSLGAAPQTQKGRSIFFTKFYSGVLYDFVEKIEWFYGIRKGKATQEHNGGILDD
jgi:hypothetical protein